MISGRIAIDHAGYTVPNLDVAVDFFTTVFGFEVVLYGGPYHDCGYTWPGEKEPEKTTLRLAVLHLGGKSNIELLEYTGVTSDHGRAPRPSHPGGAHLALYVEDIYEVEKELRLRSDIQFLAGVEVEEGGPISGTDWAYCLTDWGMVIELIRWSPGLPYERTTKARLALPPWMRAAEPS
ncbi:VOC family protein [Rhodococcus fascians]|uniref:VOC family protein n=1 Tax=Rhodococcoides fascians TaxID=1828 RepID=UPI001C9069C0|nr:VOC family protein [Rhodococcus fascians]MBY3792979.1 VOC family protein [Rhodococcus fascians]MBY3825736.1 VOC family protein [Rhodococcus fascians]MBY3836198.1 VOC family protein [Rhodococcus fascians]MBY3866394.1 VOC family protein [Rhodococcus fascians]MBY3884880.1 VOC family protein [Rhodococcus fascians]